MADLAVSRRPASLLTLPAELRIRIYSYLVPDADNFRCGDLPKPRSQYLRKDQSPCAPALLQVNRQIHAELIVEWYARSTFHLCMNALHTLHPGHCFLIWGRGGIAHERESMYASLAMVKHLNIDLSMWGHKKENPIDSVCWVLYNCKCIQSLNLRLYPDFGRFNAPNAPIRSIKYLVVKDFLRAWPRFHHLPQLSDITTKVNSWRGSDSDYYEPDYERNLKNAREYLEELEKYLQAMVEALKRPPHERVILTKEGQMTYRHKKVKA